MRAAIFSLMLILPAAVFGNTLTGSARASGPGVPVEGACVAIEGMNVLAYSAKDGSFSLKGISPGEYRLSVFHPDYKRQVIEIRVKRDFYIQVDLEKAVYTAALQADGGSIPERYGTQSITDKDMSTMPMRGAGDGLHLLQSLPGVGGGFSLATVPVIRGGNPLYDRFYVDGLPIDFPYHFAAGLLPLISSINDAAIDRAEVIKGLSPMNFDDNLGNIISIKTKEPSQTGARGKLILDPLFPLIPTLYAEAVPFRDFSVVCAVRRSTFDYLTDITYMDFRLMDYFAKVSYNIFDSHRFTFTAIGADDITDYNEYSTESGNRTLALAWDFMITRNLMLSTSLSSYETLFHIENSDINESGVGFYMRFEPLQYRAFQQLGLAFRNFYMKSGYEYISHRRGVKANISLEDLAFSNIRNSTDIKNVTSRYPIEGDSISVFTESGANAGPVWVNLGIRYNKYGPTSEKTINWRGMAGVNLPGRTALYGGSGVYHAHPDIYYYVGVTDPEDKNIITSLIDHEVSDSKAVNSLVGLKSSYFKTVTPQVELYHSKFENLMSAPIDHLEKTNYKKMTQLSPFANEQSGTSRGIEFYLKYAGGSVSGWISYALSESKRDSADGNSLNYFSDFDQTHIFRLAAAKQFGRWTPSMILHYYTAMPVTPVTGSKLAPGSDDKYVPSYGAYNSGRKDPHHRLDLRLNYIGPHGDRFYAEVWNIYYNRNNVLVEAFDARKPFGNSNPRSVTEYPPLPDRNFNTTMLWLGMELCLQ